MTGPSLAPRPEVMAAVAEGRAEALAAISQPGTPHPWNSPLFDTAYKLCVIYESLQADAGRAGALDRDLLRWMGARVNPGVFVPTVEPREYLDLVEACIGKIYTPEGAHLWMTKPQRRFGNRSAAKLITEGNGPTVLAAAQALAEGNFS